jgi:uncharacterized protein (TIGR02118 family)
MQKFIYVTQRRPEVAVDAFQQQWPECCRQVATAHGRVLRCAANLPLPQGYRTKAIPFDGVLELWLTDETEARDLRHQLSEAGAELAKSDAIALSVRVSVIKDGPPAADGLKIIEMVKRRKDLPFTSFHTYWRDVHGPLAAAIPQLLRYEQNSVSAQAYRDQEPACDGFAVTWFRSSAEMREAAQTSEFARAAQDEPHFLSGEPVPFIIARETLLQGC